MKLRLQVGNGFEDASTLAASDTAGEESGSFEESGHLEEVKEANDLCEDIEESDREDDQDFWAVICDGSKDETCPNPSYTDFNEIEGHDKESDLKSSINNIEFVKIGESDDESFEAISAIAFLLGEETTDTIQSNSIDGCISIEKGEYVADEDETEDFWAKLQRENEASDFQNQKSDREEFSDPNSWSMVGSSDVPVSEEPSYGCQSEVIKSENQMDMFDYLEGLTIWDENGSEGMDDFDNDELNYLVGVTIWEEEPSLLNEQESAIEGQTCALHKSTINSSSYGWDYYNHSDFADQKDMIREPDVLFFSQESMEQVSLDNDGLEDMGRDSASPRLDEQNSSSVHFATPAGRPIHQEAQEAPKGAVAKNGSSQRFPKHSMIPKPKKQNQQKSNSEELSAPNGTNTSPAALDRPGSRRSRDRDREKERDRDRDRRRRGRGSLSAPRAFLFYERFPLFVVVCTCLVVLPPPPSPLISVNVE